MSTALTWICVRWVLILCKIALVILSLMFKQLLVLHMTLGLCCRKGEGFLSEEVKMSGHLFTLQTWHLSLNIHRSALGYPGRRIFHGQIILGSAACLNSSCLCSSGGPSPKSWSEKIVHSLFCTIWREKFPWALFVKMSLYLF